MIFFLFHSENQDIVNHDDPTNIFLPNEDFLFNIEHDEPLPQRHDHGKSSNN